VGAVSNEEKKSKKRSVDSEEFEAGRIFALLKRRDPSLYEEIVSIMESENKDPSDIVHEAFALYRDYKYMVGVDPRALAYAIRVVQVFQQRAIELMAFSIDYFSRLMGAGPEQVAETVVRRLSEELKKTRESEKKGEEEGLPKSVRAKLAELTATTLMKMVETMFAMMPRPATTPQVATQVATQAQQAPDRRPKIVTGTGKGTTGAQEKKGGEASSSGAQQ
jgi:hypothetical protein